MFSKVNSYRDACEVESDLAITDVPPPTPAPTKSGGSKVSRVFRICNSYESGYGHGVSGDGLDSTKTIISDLEAAEAYQIGYEAGANAVKRN